MPHFSLVQNPSSAGLASGLRMTDKSRPRFGIISGGKDTETEKPPGRTVQPKLSCSYCGDPIESEDDLGHDDGRPVHRSCQHVANDEFAWLCCRDSIILELGSALRLMSIDGLDEQRQALKGPAVPFRDVFATLNVIGFAVREKIKHTDQNVKSEQALASLERSRSTLTKYLRGRR